MFIYENGNNDYGKQISDFKGYISEIEQDLAEVKDLNDEATMLSDIQNGFYNTNVVKFLNPTSDEVEFTGTSPTFVEVCIYALYNRQVIFQLDYYQQRLFIPFAPAVDHLLIEFFFHGRVLGLPEATVLYGVW